MKKRIVIRDLILAAAAAAAFCCFAAPGTTPENRIAISGNIELTEVNIAFKTAGRLIERTVDEGDAVKKGQVIARLDRDQLAGAARARGGGARRPAKSQLAQAQTAVEWQRATLAADLEQRRADVASCGSAPGGTAERRAAAGKAGREGRGGSGGKRKWSARSKDWERAQMLYKNDDISTAQFDQFRNRFESAAGGAEAGRRSARRWWWPGRAWNRSTPQAGQVERARAAREDGGGERARIEAPRAGARHAARGDRAREGQPGADRYAAGRHRGGVAGRWRGAGEGGGRGRSAGAGHDGGDGRRHRSSLAARLRQRDRPGEGEARREGEGDHGFVSGQGLQRARDVHLVARRSSRRSRSRPQQERVKLVYRIKIEVENPERELKSNMPADAEIRAGAVMEADHRNARPDQALRRADRGGSSGPDGCARARSSGWWVRTARARPPRCACSAA